MCSTLTRRDQIFWHLQDTREGKQSAGQVVLHFAFAGVMVGRVPEDYSVPGHVLFCENVPADF